MGGDMETAAMTISTRGKSFREHQRQEIEQLRERLLHIASGGKHPMTQPGHHRLSPTSIVLYTISESRLRCFEDQIRWSVRLLMHVEGHHTVSQSTTPNAGPGCREAVSEQSTR